MTPQVRTFLHAVVFASLSLLFINAFAVADDKPKVLYLGDSLSIGSFGQTFDSWMRETGLEVHTVVAGGASPYYWLKAYQTLPCTIGFWEKSPTSERRLGYVRAVPKLEDLVEEYSPDVVVVQTGINLYATLRSRRRPAEENREEVRSLIDQMCFSISQQGAHSYWILPPHSHESRYPAALQQELAELMESVVKKYKGGVFESQEYTQFVDPYPATDGIHYGPEEARQWAEKVSTDFSRYMKIAESKEVERTMVRAVPLRTTNGQSATSLFAASGGEGYESLPSDSVELQLRLVEKSELTNLSELEYSNALGVYEYEVLDVITGSYDKDRIRVAHGIVFQRKHTSSAKRAIGSEIALTLVPLSKYKNLQTWQTVDNLRPNFELPLYTPKLD